MALELDISTQVAHQQIDALGKKIEELGPIAQKAGTVVKSAFGRQAYRDIQAALASLRREYEKVIAAHTALRKVTNEYLQATAAVAAAVKVQETSTLSASLATSNLNKVMSQNVGFAKYAQREALILAKAQAKAAAAAEAQAAANTVAAAASQTATAAKKNQNIAELRLMATQMRSVTLAGAIAEAWSGTAGQFRAGAQAAAALRGSLYGANLGIGVFTGTTIIAGASLFALASQIRQTLDAGSTFERTFDRISAMLEGTEQQMAGLKDTIFELGVTTQYSANEVADAALELSLAGLTASESILVLKDVTNLAAIAMFDLKDSAEIVINQMNAFNIPAEEMYHVVDVMAYAANESSITLRDFANSMKYVGPAAHAAGTPIEEVAAALIVLGNAGIKGSQAGTGLRRVFVSMARPTAMAAKSLADLGVQTKNFDGTSRSLTDVFEQLGRKGAKSMDLIRIFGIHAFSAVSVLLDKSKTGALEAGKSLKGYAEKMKELDGYAEGLKKTIEDNVLTAFKKLKSTLESLQILGFEQIQKDMKNDLDELTQTLRANAGDIASVLGNLASGAVKALVFLAKHLRGILALVAGFAAWKVAAAAVAVLTGAFKWLKLQALLNRKALVGLTVTMKAAKLVTLEWATALNVLSKVPILTWVGLVVQALSALYIWFSVYSDEVSDASSETASFGTELGLTTEEIEKMTGAQLALAAINLGGKYDEQTEKLKKMREEIARLTAMRDATLSPKVKAGKDQFGFSAVTQKDLERAAQLTKDIAVKEAELNFEIERHVSIEEQLARVLTRQKEVKAGVAKQTEEDIDIINKSSDAYTMLLEKLTDQYNQLGLNKFELAEYDRTFGELSETIYLASAAMTEQQKSELRSLQDTKNRIGLKYLEMKALKEQGKVESQAYKDAEKALAELLALEKEQGATVERNTKAMSALIRDEVALRQLRIISTELLKEYVAAYDDLTGGMNGTREEMRELHTVMALYRTGVLDADEAAKKLHVSVETLNNAMDEYEFDKALRSTAKALETMNPAIDGLYEAYRNLNQEVPDFNKFMEQAEAKVAESGASLLVQKQVLSALALVYEDAAVKAQGFGRSQKSLYEQGKKATGQLKEDIWLMEYKIGLWRKGAHYIDLNEMAWQKFNRTLEELTDTEVELLLRSRELMDELERIEEVQGAWDDFLDGLDQTFEDVFTGAIKSFTEFRDKLIGDFREMLGKLVYLALKEKILLKIRPVFVGGGPGGATQYDPGNPNFMGPPDLTQPGGMTQVGGFDFASPFTSALSGFGSGAGAFFTGGANHLTNPMVGSTSSAIGYGFAGAASGYASGNLVNNLLGGGGSPGQTNTLSSIGGAIGSIWGPIGSLIGGAIGGLVSNMLGGAKTVIDKGLNLGITNGVVGGTGYTRIKTDGGWFGSDSYSTRIKELGADDLAGLNEILSAAFNTLATIATSLGEDASFFEQFSAARQKFSTKGKSEAEVQKMLEDWINSVIAGAITGFIGQAQGLSQTFSEVVESFRGDTEEFVRAFELMAAVDLTRRLDPLAKSLTDYTNAQKTATQLYFENVDALLEMTDDFDLTLDSLEELGTAYAQNREMAYQLAYALRQVEDEITAMFSNTSETIRQALMTPDQLYAYQDQRVDALVAMLTTLTDPTQILETSQEINELVNSMFGSLDEAQQQLLGPEYLTFLDEITALAATQIDEALQAIGDSAQEVNLEIDTTLFDAAAERQMQAAEALLHAAELLAAAARGQQTGLGGGISGGGAGGTAFNNLSYFDPNALRDEVGPIPT